MSPAIINLILQLVSGAAGGNAAGKVNPSFGLGSTIANSIVGALGGVGGGYLLSTLLPNLISTAEGAGFDVTAIATQIVGGGVAGAVGGSPVYGSVRRSLVDPLVSGGLTSGIASTSSMQQTVLHSSRMQPLVPSRSASALARWSALERRRSRVSGRSRLPTGGITV